MKLNGYLFLVCLCIVHKQFGMESHTLAEMCKFEYACNAIKNALSENKLSLLKEPIEYFMDLQKKQPFPNDIRDFMAQYPSPLICVVQKIKDHDNAIIFYETISKDLMLGSDISPIINQYQQLKHRDFELLKLLCSSAPWLVSFAWNNREETPLLCAAFSNVPMCQEIELLLRYNADPSQDVSRPSKYKNPLEAATAFGHETIVDLLIKYGNKSKEKNVGDSTTRANFSITGPSKKKLKKQHEKLLKTVEFNDSEGFKKIINKDYIDINYVYHNQKDGYKYLLAYLLDNYFVQRQLFFIIMYQPSEELAMPKNIVDTYYGAAQEMLFYLLSKNPDVRIEYTYNPSKENIPNKTYQTPLKEAIKYNARPLIIKLLEAGADPDYKDSNDDLTPLEYAYEQNPELALFIKTLLKEQPKKDLLTTSE